MRVELVKEFDDGLVDGLAEVLVDCVASGASVGFVGVLAQERARAWWRSVIGDPDALTWVARDETNRVVGTVRLALATQDNGPHRAEVVKLLVHRDARGKGCASALMAALEDTARALGRRVLVLDTQTGSLAEGLYARRGWQRVGTVDDFALTPDGVLAPTTIMVKHLAA
ncbi:GNAT family N-acetyltransferase [Actinokineospora xionganensis]|uniref:GNAT family N-acetyltransferase n=1 Tax=Actinokineospora xionganensis TaxID=2684470 RepID=A0ABR7L5H2_9PSEU|nr:GNAT family N-acetyltransferase [Actinokineospora xionganensis]MBC6447709.1 GNAT family N-acetyltransferase [Actinokineospora xionganensis]